MKLGIGTYSYMWAIGTPGHVPARPLTAFDLLDRCAALGVRLVQLGPNLPLDATDLDALAAAAAGRGVEIEVGILGLEPAQIQRGVQLCRRLHASILRTVDLYEGPARSRAEVESLLRAALPLLEPAGVRLAVENARTPARHLSAALDSIGSPFLGVTLDTVNSLSIPEGTREVVDSLARHTLCLHVKDFRIQRIWHSMGFTVEGTAAGEGQLDIPWLLGQLASAGRDPNAILELWVPQQQTLEETIALEDSWANRSIAYLRRLIPN